MDKMALLAASTSEPSVTLRQGSDVLATLGPLIQFAPRFRETVAAVSYFLFVRSYFAASITVASLLAASRVTIIQTCLLTKFLALRSAALAKFVSWKAWNSKSCRRLRKKLEFEFFVLVLGPGGNALFLLIFWPGWILAAGAIWALWSWAS